MRGHIVRIPKDKHFGFIHGENSTEYFFHKADFDGHWDNLVLDFYNNRNRQKIQVEFQIDLNSPKGPRAEKVKRLDWPNQYA